MTEEWKEKFNVKCAIFMKVPRLKDDKGDLWDYRKTGEKIYSLRTNLLRFHSDWEWIMQLVTKIRNEGWRFDTVHSGSVSSKDINVFIWRKYPGGGETELV